VAGHAGLQSIFHLARHAGAAVSRLQAGEEFAVGGARLRVLSPPRPDWERRRVRNDDSVVLEVVYGDVAILLTGDIGAEVERAILSRLTPARIRVLKVGHHGSRTSSSRELLEGWRPTIALVSSGRGNPFGHPAPDVVERLQAVGAAVYRTDRDGQITLTTDGRRARVTTYTGAAGVAEF
jgi:competence protein ComEC